MVSVAAVGPGHPDTECSIDRKTSKPQQRPHTCLTKDIPRSRVVTGNVFITPHSFGWVLLFAWRRSASTCYPAICHGERVSAERSNLLSAEDPRQKVGLVRKVGSHWPRWNARSPGARSLAAYGRAAQHPYLSERFIMSVGASLVQEMGATAAGNATQSAFRAVVGGIMTKRGAEQFERLGLLNPKDVLHTSTIGTQLKLGAIKGWQIFTSDPDVWAQKILMPALAKAGITKPMDVLLAFQQLFSNRMAGNVANVLGVQSTRINKDVAMLGQTAATQHNPAAAVAGCNPKSAPRLGECTISPDDLAPPFWTFAQTATSAPNWLDVLDPIFLAVIVAELFARRYMALGHNNNAPLLVFLWLTIR
jgi:hypothetical protein